MYRLERLSIMMNLQRVYLASMTVYKLEKVRPVKNKCTPIFVSHPPFAYLGIKEDFLCKKPINCIILLE